MSLSVISYTISSSILSISCSHSSISRSLIIRSLNFFSISVVDVVIPFSFHFNVFNFSGHSKDLSCSFYQKLINLNFLLNFPHNKLTSPSSRALLIIVISAHSMYVALVNYSPQALDSIVSLHSFSSVHLCFAFIQGRPHSCRLTARISSSILSSTFLQFYTHSTCTVLSQPGSYSCILVKLSPVSPLIPSTSL